jgi:molybdopterin-guanine dinucleotide biosynthesis protein A
VTAPELPVGVILAGGLARRLGGGDKTLHVLAGRRMLDRIIERLQPQTAALIVSANGDPARFVAGNVPVVPDDIPDQRGPLAGILAALDWTAANRPDVGSVLSVPGDSPFIPADLAVRLGEARAAAGAVLACAVSGGRHHAATALWPVGLRRALRHALTVDGERGVERFAARYRVTTAAWATEPFDPFLNINTPEELHAAGRIAAGGFP